MDTDGRSNGWMDRRLPIEPIDGTGHRTLFLCSNILLFWYQVLFMNSTYWLNLPSINHCFYCASLDLSDRTIIAHTSTTLFVCVCVCARARGLCVYVCVCVCFGVGVCYKVL